MNTIIKKVAAFCSITAIVFMIGACEVFNSDTDLDTESGIAAEGLEIYFRELHFDTTGQGDQQGTDPELFLVLQTKEIMPCVNYIVNYETRDSGKEPLIREINLLGVELPGFLCLTALGPATSYVSLKDAPHNLRLKIRDGHYNDIFDLTITKESVEITPLYAAFTETIYQRYFRKPENSFYFYCNTQKSMSELCQDFHNLMKSELAITEFEFPEEGYIPYPESSSDTYKNRSTRYYRYHSEEDFDAAGALLEEFTRERIVQGEGNSLSIINWRDEGYRSWMFSN